MPYKEREISIGEVKKLIEDGYELEVESPDGYVKINKFVDKGLYKEYLLNIDGFETVRCNQNHLFETDEGWLSAIDILNRGKVKILTKTGYHVGEIISTENIIPIVDIEVDHSNHRYYTNGISSHNTGVGKSLCLCHIAASALIQNRNVLYITLEMSEEKIAERIDANLLDINIQTISELPRSIFESKVNSISQKTQGTLIIKEYPTASAHCGHFRSLLNDLYLKKSFKPDIIFVDYMNICASSRYKANMSVNSYSYVKAIAEELRGLAVEYDVPLITATQVNRSGASNTDMDITDTSESFGGPMTADLLLALISTEEFEEQNKILIKQLKNRYSDPTLYKRFFVGIDRSKMRLYDIDQSPVDIKDEEEYDESETKPQLKQKFGEFKF